MPFSCPSCHTPLSRTEGSVEPLVRCPVCARDVVVIGGTIDFDDARSTLPADGIAGVGSHTTHIFPFLGPPAGPGEIGRLDHYRVLRLLGQGGMGVVFEAEDTVLRRLVAVKVMRPELARADAARQRFLREARSAAAIRHPHVVTIYQVGPEREVPYLAMELLHGESLETRLRRVGKLPVAEVLRIGREIAEGLAAAHDRGLVHRDVKPANVWLSATSEPPTGTARTAAPPPPVKLIDFGLALLGGEEANLTRSGAVLGTPAYMAPEQADGVEVDGRADLFSLGCMLYRMATGEVPFKGKGTISTLRAMVKMAPEAPAALAPEVPHELSQLILRLLQEDPGRRPSSAREVAAILHGLEVGRRRLYPLMIAAAVAAIAIIGVGLAILNPWRQSKAIENVIGTEPPPPKPPDDRTPLAVQRIDPPEIGFYSKRLDYKGIPIKAHAAVADEALRIAHQRLEMMLQHCPRVVENLVASGAELHIIGKDQQTSDLPEHRHLKGKRFDGELTVDQRSRGLGGLYASCGEENLLHLPGDRYAGRDICVHEFAHTIRSYGLSDNVRRQLDYQYRRSLSKGLWKGAYAATNDDEFFAEISMWYFGTHGDTSRMTPKPAPGREGLRRYDPEAFGFAEDLYSGKLAVARNTFVLLVSLPTDQESTLRSEQSTRTSSIQFVNRTSRPLHIYWLDFQGQRKSYGILAPGSAHQQHTFATHPWVVVDDANKVRALVVAMPEPGRAVIVDK
jgi:serine/threonine protein kinase